MAHTTLSWVNPTARADGSAYTQAQNAGYEIQFDGVGQVSVPVAWGTSFDLSTLAAFTALPVGTHQLGLAVVDTGGLVSSYTTISFPKFSGSPPLAPTAVALA
jgi:hypothetical protein